MAIVKTSKSAPSLLFSGWEQLEGMTDPPGWVSVNQRGPRLDATRGQL